MKGSKIYSFFYQEELSRKEIDGKELKKLFETKLFETSASGFSQASKLLQKIFTPIDAKRFLPYAVGHAFNTLVSQVVQLTSQFTDKLVI